MTKFENYINALSDAGQLDSYAQRCGTSPRYIREQLKNRNKVPRPSFMAALAKNSGGKLKRNDLLNHFYPEDLFAYASKIIA